MVKLSVFLLWWLTFNIGIYQGKDKHTNIAQVLFTTTNKCIKNNSSALKLPLKTSDLITFISTNHSVRLLIFKCFKWLFLVIINSVSLSFNGFVFIRQFTDILVLKMTAQTQSDLIFETELRPSVHTGWQCGVCVCVCELCHVYLLSEMIPSCKTVTFFF